MMTLHEFLTQTSAFEPRSRLVVEVESSNGDEVISAEVQDVSFSTGVGLDSLVTIRAWRDA